MMKFNISGYEIEAQFGECVDEHVLGQTMQRANGVISIIIGEGQTDRSLVDTFVHELVEAVCMIFNIEITHQSIQTLGVGLSQVLPLKASASYLRKALRPQKKPKA